MDQKVGSKKCYLLLVILEQFCIGLAGGDGLARCLEADLENMLCYQVERDNKLI